MCKINATRFLSIESQYLTGPNEDDEDYFKPIQMGFLSIPLPAHCNHPLSQQLGLTLRELKKVKLIKRKKAKEATKPVTSGKASLYLTRELD